MNINNYIILTVED